MPAARAGVPEPSFTAAQELFRADGLTLNSNSDTVTANVVNQVTGKTGTASPTFSGVTLSLFGR